MAQDIKDDKVPLRTWRDGLRSALSSILWFTEDKATMAHADGLLVQSEAERKAARAAEQNAIPKRGLADELRSLALLRDKTAVSDPGDKPKPDAVQKFEKKMMERDLLAFLEKNKIPKEPAPQRDAESVKMLKGLKKSWVPELLRDLGTGLGFFAKEVKNDIAGDVKFTRVKEGATAEDRMAQEWKKENGQTLFQRLRYAFTGWTPDGDQLKKQGLTRTAMDDVKSYAIPFARDNTSMVDIPDLRLSTVTPAREAFAKAAPRPAVRPMPAINVGPHHDGSDRAPAAKTQAPFQPVPVQPHRLN